MASSTQYPPLSQDTIWELRVWERFARGLLPALSYNVQVAEHLGDHDRSAHYHQLQEHIHNFWKHTDYWTALARQYGYEENAPFDPDRRERSIMAWLDAISEALREDLARLVPTSEHAQLDQQLTAALRQGMTGPRDPNTAPSCNFGCAHIFLNHGEMEERKRELRANDDANGTRTPTLEEALRRLVEFKERLLDEAMGRIKEPEARTTALAAQLKETNAKEAESVAQVATGEVEALRLRLERQQLDDSA
ncbi:hypothetical protein EV714DRAFT_239920 [Schizophyllum commune]